MLDPLTDLSEIPGHALSLNHAGPPPGQAKGALTAGPVPHAVHEASFDPKIILHVILKRLWLLLAIILIAPTICWLYVRKLPPQFQATASMVLDNSTPQVLGSQFREIVDYEGGSWWSTREYQETQFQIIRSRTMAGDVAARLCAREATDPKMGARIPTAPTRSPSTRPSRPCRG
jgi:hypothetical protein